MPRIPSRPPLDLSGKWVLAVLPSMPDGYLDLTPDPHVTITHTEFERFSGWSVPCSTARSAASGYNGLPWLRVVAWGLQMAKAPKRTAKPTRGKKAYAEFTGTTNAPVQIEVRITDDSYEVDLLGDDIDKKRAWFEPRADAQGWFKLVYSADGPTGDPWPIGKIRFAFDPNYLDNHFGNASGVKLSKTTDE